VKQRIVGTQNIAKITKSMKMVSAAKLRGDQARLVAFQPLAVRKAYKEVDFKINIYIFVGLGRKAHWKGQANGRS
jgi:F0F1-type ATP synthase gamma subunit